MTSKNLYFKLMKEDLKSRLWAVSLIGLGFFFTFPVAAAFMAGSIKEAADYEKALHTYVEEITTWLSFESGMTMFLMMLIALICGMSSFSYLNSRSKVDFYHSIPVRREKLYIVNFLDGILIMAVPYAVTLFLGTVIAISNGAQATEIWRIAAVSYGLNLVYYILMYSTVIVAVMMTGNLVVSFLGTLVFSLAIPLAVAINEAYFSAFFQTHLSRKYDTLMEWGSHLSPVAEYFIQAENYRSKGVSGMAIAMALAGAVILAVSGGFLYRKRPSEAAGRAMAFHQTRPVIRVILTVISALGLGLLFWSMRYSTSWTVFGIICGGTIAHCVIEIIYHSDFKKLFANWIQLVGCMTVSLLILLAFRYDWLGYDTYLPEQGKVKEAAVNVEVMNDWTSYGKTVKRTDGSYGWESISSRTYVFNNMQLGDIETALDIAQAGIAENEIRASKAYDGNNYGYYYGYVMNKGGDIYTDVEIQYTLDSGRRTYRRYTLPVEKYRDLLNTLNASESYKNGMFPVMTLTPDRIAEVRYLELYPEIRLGEMTMEEKAELLTAYQQDFKELTLDLMSKESPVGLIRFMTTEDVQGIAWMELAKQQHYSHNNYSDIEGRDFYPIYTSFERTNKLIKKYGIEPGDDLNDLQIKNISVTYRGKHDDYDTEVSQTVIDDPKEVEEVMARVRPSNFNYYNRLFLIETEWEAKIVFSKSDAKSQSISVVFPKGQVPGFLNERLTKMQ